jgi:flagellar biosynthesis chaperone FliJ
LKKFSFSLQTLLDINISLEKQQKNEIAAINNRIRILEEEISRKELEIEEVQNKAKKEIKAHCKVEKIKSLNIYITGLNKKLQATKDLLEIPFVLLSSR